MTIDEYAAKFPEGTTYGDTDLPWWAGLLVEKDEEIKSLRNSLANMVHSTPPRFLPADIPGMPRIDDAYWRRYWRDT